MVSSLHVDGGDSCPPDRSRPGLPKHTSLLLFWTRLDSASYSPPGRQYLSASSHTAPRGSGFSRRYHLVGAIEVQDNRNGDDESGGMTEILATRHPHLTVAFWCACYFREQADPTCRPKYLPAVYNPPFSAIDAWSQMRLMLGALAVLCTSTPSEPSADSPQSAIGVTDSATAALHDCSHC